MPVIHHVGLGVERDVDETQAAILTTNPRVPWKHGPLPRPTAATNPSPEGDTTPSPEED